MRAIVVCAAVLWGAAAEPVSLAGPLDPPAGPVTATGKALTEVEPRVAVNEVNTPGSGSARYRITAPGSYYLTRSLQNTVQESGSVVSIEASDVTLDLNGFTIDGNQQSTQISVDGVRVLAGQSRVRIRNGVIKRCQHGVHAREASGVIVEGLRISDVLLGVWASNNGVVRRCLMTDGQPGAIGVDALIVTDVRISGCTITGFSYGLNVASAVNVLAEDCVFSNCTWGVRVLTGAQRTSVVNCRVRQCEFGIRNTNPAAHNTFLSNIATGCTESFGGVPNVATDPQTASAWANLAL